MVFISRDQSGPDFQEKELYVWWCFFDYSHDGTKHIFGIFPLHENHLRPILMVFRWWMGHRGSGWFSIGLLVGDLRSDDGVDIIITHRIHVWYIYLHLVDFMVNVGKYTSPMDAMGHHHLLSQWADPLHQQIIATNQPAGNGHPKWWWKVRESLQNPWKIQVLELYSFAQLWTYTPEDSHFEPENTPRKEEENHPKTAFFRFQALIFGGVIST